MTNFLVEEWILEFIQTHELLQNQMYSKYVNYTYEVSSDIDKQTLTLLAEQLITLKEEYFEEVCIKECLDLLLTLLSQGQKDYIKSLDLTSKQLDFENLDGGNINTLQISGGRGNDVRIRGGKTYLSADIV